MFVELNKFIENKLLFQNKGNYVKTHIRWTNLVEYMVSPMVFIKINNILIVLQVLGLLVLGVGT